VDFFSVDHLEALADRYLVPFSVNLALAILVFLIGRAVARLIVRAIGRVAERAKLDESLRKFLCDMSYAVLLMVVVITALERLGIKTTAAIAVLGAAGLAVGFALQSSLGNFASGVMIIVFKPYKVGDVVTVAGQTGKVDGVKIFNTVLVTPDNLTMMIPNGQITAGTIVNLTALGTRRVDLVFGIGYGDDIKKAKELLDKLVREDSRVLADPAPVVAVSELADSSVNFVVRPWCAVADYWDVRFSLIERVKLEFDAAGISIPFPQRDVHLHQLAS